MLYLLYLFISLQLTNSMCAHGWFSCLQLINCLNSSKHVPILPPLLHSVGTWLGAQTASASFQIVRLAMRAELACQKRNEGIFQEVHVGRWDGFIAQSRDPLETQGCEAHMGKQSADELLTWAAHHGLGELSPPEDLTGLRIHAASAGTKPSTNVAYCAEMLIFFFSLGFCGRCLKWIFATSCNYGTFWITEGDNVVKWVVLS